MAQYLGLDASTQSLTALIIDGDLGGITAEATVRFDDHFSETYGVENGVVELGNGIVHSYPLMWVEALDLLFDTLAQRGHDLSTIAAVSGSGQQHGTVYLNETASLRLANLAPRASLREQLAGIFSRQTAPVWMDSSTTDQCREIEETVGREMLIELSGNSAFERFSAAQIRKFHQEDPDAYERTAHIALVSSFMASLLAGRIVPVDAGDGSGTNLMDIRARQWNERIQQATAPSLAERMAPVVASCVPIGPVHGYFVQRHGFAEGCLVVPFSGDNPCSLIGLGMIEPGQAALSLGTLRHALRLHARAPFLAGE